MFFFVVQVSNKNPKPNYRQCRFSKLICSSQLIYIIFWMTFRAAPFSLSFSVHAHTHISHSFLAIRSSQRFLCPEPATHNPIQLWYRIVSFFQTCHSPWNVKLWPWPPPIVSDMCAACWFEIWNIYLISPHFNAGQKNENKTLSHTIIGFLKSLTSVAMSGWNTQSPHLTVTLANLSIPTAHFFFFRSAYPVMTTDL